LGYLFANRVIPEVLLSKADNAHDYVSLFNVGFLRSSLYSGKVIEDDVISIVPFVDNFRVCNRILGSDLKIFLSAIKNLSPDFLFFKGDPEFLTEFHSRGVFVPKIRALHENSLTSAEDWNQWVKSSNYRDIDNSKFYNLLGMDYDFILFQRTLNNLFGSKYSSEEFNSTFTPRSILRDFVESKFVCNASPISIE
jgi:hypothetical protein